MNLYVVFNNGYSGILKSQVIDRLSWLRSEQGIEFKLVVLISIRSFFSQRRKFKSADPNAIVLPLLGGLKFWKTGLLFLIPIALINRPKVFVGRAIFATGYGLSLKNFGLVGKVIYDGRGAVSAEWREYLGKSGWPIPYSKIQNIERAAILESDDRISVSEALKNYWQQEFDAPKEITHAVIPCTLNENFVELAKKSPSQQGLRERLGFPVDDVILLFSGSRSDWQVFEFMRGFLEEMLRAHSAVKLIILSNQTLPSDFKEEFRGQLTQKWVSPDEVEQYYSIADYGLLIREPAMTNQVAAPVKFAEYLAAGLKVIISPKIGDYSQLVKEKELGFVLGGEAIPALERIPQVERERIKSVALEVYSFGQYKSELTKMLN